MAFSVLGFEVSRKKSLAGFLTSRQVELVVDVGGNVGQFGKRLRSDGYKGRICSFEPVSSAFAKLEAASRNDPGWQINNFALGAQPGTAQINVSRSTVYSSILEQTEMAGQFSHRSAVSSVEEIEVRRLDDIALDCAGPIFLKIDTQGFEQQVLEGAAATLPRCAGLMLELPVEHLYSGVWSFAEAVSTIDALGFVPAQFEMVNPVHDDPHSGIEFDCLFRRKRVS